MRPPGSIASRVLFIRAVSSASARHQLNPIFRFPNTYKSSFVASHFAGHQCPASSQVWVPAPWGSFLSSETPALARLCPDSHTECHRSGPLSKLLFEESQPLPFLPGLGAV